MVAEADAGHKMHFPIYRRTDVQKHRKMEDRIWVSYRDGVYDITEFVKIHPGGSSKLLMAAGGALEQFWEMYPFHKVDNIRSMLVPYKIGELHPDDRINEPNIRLKPEQKIQ